MSDLHNRFEELLFLNSRFKERPKEITVILGPQSCGKTKLIKSFFEESGQLSLFGSYLDARAAKLSEPRQFAASLVVCTDHGRTLSRSLANTPWTPLARCKSRMVL